MITPDDGVIRYRLNERDEIVFVNDAWVAFAAANGGERLAAADVLGRPLWDFISDPTTRQLCRDIVKRTRTGHSTRFTFRCDSPTCRRLLEMEVTHAPGGAIDFRTRVVSLEDRPPQPLLATDRARSPELVRVCSWCKKIDVGGRWAEVEEAVTHLGLFECTLLPDLTHGICDPCYARMTDILRKGGDDLPSL